jgi:Family of unknown function (DUF6069)
MHRRDAPATSLNAGLLWAGGVGTAVVAGLIVVVGVLVVRGILDVALLAPSSAAAYGDRDTTTYALYAAGAALLATALLHVLLAFMPSPVQFFGWIAGLVTVAATLLPFTRGARMDTMVATAAINLVVGLAILSLLSSVAAMSMRHETPAPPYG